MENYWYLYLEQKMNIEDAYVACHNAMQDAIEGSPLSVYDDYKEQLVNLSTCFICLQLVHDGYDYNNGKYLKRDILE